MPTQTACALLLEAGVAKTVAISSAQALATKVRLRPRDAVLSDSGQSRVTCSLLFAERVRSP